MWLLIVQLHFANMVPQQLSSMCVAKQRIHGIHIHVVCHITKMRLRCGFLTTPILLIKKLAINLSSTNTHTHTLTNMSTTISLAYATRARDNYAILAVCLTNINDDGYHGDTGTGSFDSVGSGNGLYHTVNLPLEDGITDEQYTTVFRRLVEAIRYDTLVTYWSLLCISVSQKRFIRGSNHVQLSSSVERTV